MNSKRVNYSSYSRDVSSSIARSSLLLARIMAVFLLLGMAMPASAALTIQPITWNVIGLDSNDVNVGPNQFPVGARVCTDVEATNLSAVFNWNTASAYIDIQPGTQTTLEVPILAAGACTDFYFAVEVDRDPAAYGETRDYTITVTADGPVSVSTPQRRLVVEYLVSQNRNYHLDLQYGTDPGSLTSVAEGGTMALMVGNTYYIKIEAATATQGYEQLQSYVGIPNTVFQILSVETTFSADSSNTVSSPSDTLYADACTWENDFDDPNYLSCLSTGKAGGDITVTYEVKILSTPDSPLLNPLTLGTMIYDFSGSSFHYNANFDASVRFAEIVSAEIIKSFVPKTILPGENSTLTFRIKNPGDAPLTNVNFTDDLPANMTLANANVSYTDCGTPSPTSGSLTDPLSFTDITIAAIGICIIEVTVTSSDTGSSPYVNTTGNLFINGTSGVPGSGTDTGSTGTDTLVVSSLPTPPSTCTTPTTIATWTMPTTGQGSGGPPPPYTTKVADVSTAVASYTTVSGTQSISTTGNPANSWGGTAPSGGVGWSETAVTSANYFEFQIDTSNYGGAQISFDVRPNIAGDWGNPQSNVFIKSSTDGVNFTVYEVSPGTYPQATKNAWTTISGIPAAATGTSTTWFRLSFDSGNKAAATILLDNISFLGCGRPLPPQLSKAFGTDPIVLGNNSTLTFTLVNPNGSALTGVTFDDVLKEGLLIADVPNIVNTCGAMVVTAPAGTSTISATGGLGANETCTISVDVTGVKSELYGNTSGNISSAETGPNTTSTGYGTDTLDVIAPPLVNKTFSDNPIFTGDTTTLTFTITDYNPYNTTLSGLSFTDTLQAGLDVVDATTSNVCGVGSSLVVSDNDPSPDTIVLSNGTLADGESCTFEVTVTGTTAGLKSNDVTVAFDNGGGVSGTGNTYSTNVLVKDPAPAIGMIKQVGPTADGPWTTYMAVTAGADVYYRFQVDNNGDIALASVDISDPALDGLIPATADCVWTDGDGVSLTAPFALPVPDADEGHKAICVLGAYAAAGSGLTNTATTSNTSGAVNASDSAQYATTDLSLTKFITGGSPFSSAGDIISYSYLVSNTGNATLTGPLSVADNKIASVSCPAGDIAPGNSITCTASYTVTAEDVGNGAVTNIATATINGVESNSDTAIAYAPPTAVTINSVSLQLIEVSDFLAGLSVEAMPTEELLALLATWDADLAALMEGSEHRLILDALTDYLDPDGDGQLALLRWDTLEERGTIGFFVFRSVDDSEWHQVNDGMLPGMITAPLGAEYMLVDPGVSEPGIYLYLIIEQEAWGTRRAYGPFELEIQR